MSNMATVSTCSKCGLSYRDSLIPHQCAEWTKGHKEVTKEQPMSDTLQEGEDQMDQHQVNRSGVCQIPGCPCRGWSAQETAGVELGNNWQRERFPVGARVEAIIPISRSRLGADIPVGTRGKVTSHCDDGRAWIFFDGYTEGHTFSEIRKYVRVVCTHQNDDERCPANATSEHQPAARGGGDDAERIQQIQKRVEEGYFCINERLEDPYNLSTRLSDTDYLLEQHQSLVAERHQFTRLIEAVKALRMRHRQRAKGLWSEDCGCDECLLLQPILTSIEHYEQRSTLK